jgi:hypothetical protein
LDIVAMAGYDVAAAARQLDVSTSQLVRFLQSEPRAFRQLNEQRVARGLKSLR